MMYLSFQAKSKTFQTLVFLTLSLTEPLYLKTFLRRSVAILMNALLLIFYNKMCQPMEDLHDTFSKSPML